MDRRTSNQGRRRQVADAAIEVIARDGVRALTHRAVDRELGLPEGTTSNVARTRRDLVAHVVARLAERAEADVAPSGAPPATVGEAADLLTAIFEVAAARPAEARARFALWAEVGGDRELHALVAAVPGRSRLHEAGRALLSGVGIPEPDARAVDLVALLTGLLHDRVSGGGRYGDRADVHAVLTAWLTGVASLQT